MWTIVKLSCMGSTTRATLLILAAVGLLAAAAWAGHRSREEEVGGTGAPMSLSMEVIGPAEARVFNGTLAPANATAYGALLAAAESGGFTVHARSFANGLYVDEIAGFRAHGAAGWVYSVERAGSREFGDRSAAEFALHAGDHLRWSWTDGGEFG